MDWYCASFSLMLISLTECVAIAWIYGKFKSCQKDLNHCQNSQILFMKIRKNHGWMAYTSWLNWLVQVLLRILKSSPIFTLYKKYTKLLKRPDYIFIYKITLNLTVWHVLKKINLTNWMKKLKYRDYIWMKNCTYLYLKHNQQTRNSSLHWLKHCTALTCMFK